MSDAQNVVGIAKAQARARIDRWLNEYAEGGGDRRAEAVELAEQAELERAEVEARFADAEDLRAEALKAKPVPYQIVRRSLLTGEPQKGSSTGAEASFKNPAMQPVAEPAPEVKAEGDDFQRALDAAITQAQRGEALLTEVRKPEEARPEPEPVPTAKVAPAQPWPDAPSAPADATAFERLLYPRGLLGHVVQYIYETDGLPDRVMALVGALCILTKALDRKVLGPLGNSVVLFILLIAETGAGKQHTMNCIRILLRAMDPRRRDNRQWDRFDAIDRGNPRRHENQGGHTFRVGGHRRIRHQLPEAHLVEGSVRQRF